MIGVGLTFLMAFALWMLVRAHFVLTEWHRRAFWLGAFALVAGPALSPFGNHPLVENVVWPLAAGLMVAEMAWHRYANRFPFLNPAKPEPVKRKRKKRKKPPES